MGSPLILSLMASLRWTLPEAALPDVPAVSPAREPAVQTDALGRVQDGETLYGTAAWLWGRARAAG